MTKIERKTREIVELLNIFVIRKSTEEQVEEVKRLFGANIVEVEAQRGKMDKKWYAELILERIAETCPKCYGFRRIKGRPCRICRGAGKIYRQISRR